MGGAGGEYGYGIGGATAGKKSAILCIIRYDDSRGTMRRRESYTERSVYRRLTKLIKMK